MKKNTILILLGIALGGVFLSLSYFFQNVRHETLSSKDLYSELERKISDKTLTSDDAFELAEVYLHEIREKGVVKNYDKLESLITYLEAGGGNTAMLNTLKASVASGKHDFEAAYKFIQEAIDDQQSDRAKHYGIKGDIELELGKYNEAVNSYQLMVNARPDFHSYSRIAYIRELYGDIEGAHTSYRLAIESGASRVENIAWAYSEQAKLYMRSDVKKAKSLYEKSLELVPNYAPATIGLSELHFYEGNRSTALDLTKQSFDIFPTAQFSTLLADLYALSGDMGQAEKYYALAQTATYDAQDIGINVDLEYAEFLGLRELKLPEALRRASQASQVRPSIKAYDVYMWTLYGNGEQKKALEIFRSVIADEKIKDIASVNPSFLFHAGVIMINEGLTKEGQDLIQKAIQLHPRFSLVESQLIKSYTNSTTPQ